ncbi:MAG TPA: hypothetical protein VFA11_16550 [Acidimicrobiales bacterium]|nr:hypothetical protein [Acidimicrobiales bacterium]
MSRSSVLTRLWLLPAACAVLGLLVAGCGSSHPRSAAPATTTTTTDPRATAVLSAYRAAQAAFNQALAQADPAWPALAQTMTGEELQSVRRILVADQMNGIVGRGDVQLYPRLVSISGDNAVVHDCLYSSSELVYAKTGKPVPPVTPPEHDGVTAEVQQVAPEVWKVATVKVTEGSCPPGY